MMKTASSSLKDKSIKVTAFPDLSDINNAISSWDLQINIRDLLVYP